MPPPPCLVRRLSTVTASTVQRGTVFENWSMQVLQKSLSMNLSRVGGRADGGVDLQGWWWLPAKTNSSDNSQGFTQRRIRVLAQCKAEKKKIGPKYVREMEGVLYHFQKDSNSTALLPETDTSVTVESPPATVGLFISNSPFTRLALARALASSLPLALLYLPMPIDQLLAEEPPQDSEDGHSPGPDAMGSMVFNPALGGTTGVLKGEFEPRWEYPTRPDRVGRPVLWWQGQRIPSCAPS